MSSSSSSSSSSKGAQAMSGGRTYKNKKIFNSSNTILLNKRKANENGTHTTFIGIRCRSQPCAHKNTNDGHNISLASSLVLNRFPSFRLPAVPLFFFEEDLLPKQSIEKDDRLQNTQISHACAYSSQQL